MKKQTHLGKNIIISYIWAIQLNKHTVNLSLSRPQRHMCVSGSIAPFILNLNTTQRLGANFLPQALYFWEKNP
jgi:hypothetical protein